MERVPEQTVAKLKEARSALSTFTCSLALYIDDQPDEWRDGPVGNAYETWLANLEHIEMSLVEIPTAPKGLI